jgi:hypothetical protein
MKTLILATAIGCCPLSSAHAQELFWGDSTGGIRQANADGSGTPTLFAPDCVHSTAVDPCTGDMYWSDQTTSCSGVIPTQGAIMRTEPGGNTTMLISNGAFISRGVAVDPVARRVYWTETLSGSTFSRICSVSMDGSGVTIDVSDSPTTPVTDPIGIQIDYVDGKMYWADFGGSLICHAQLDGSIPPGAVSTVLFDLTLAGANPEAVVVDRTAGQIYWTNAAGGIGMGSLTGTGPTAFLPAGTIFTPGALALDRQSRTLFFDSFVPGGGGSYEIRSHDLSNQQNATVHNGLSELNGGLAFDAGSLGTAYCAANPNSSGAAAELCVSGSTSVSANDLVLSAGPLDANQPGIFYYGPNQIQAVFGDGFRCVGGPGGTIVRIFPFALSDAGGTMVQLIDNSVPSAGSMTAGATLNFQCWFRDPAGAMSGFNLSDARELTFAP